MNIQLVRLSSGEELIADVTVEENSLLLKKPVILLPTGQQSVGIVPWLPYADMENGVSISNNFILFFIPPHGDLINEYNSAFGNGLVVPPKQSVSGPALTLTE